MIRTYKVKLKPNNKQKDALLRQLGAARFAYNWVFIWKNMIETMK